MGASNHKYAILPCLKAKMEQMQATHVTLSEASGVSIGCIHRARAGQPIHVNLGIALYDSLRLRQFRFKKTGPHAKADATTKEATE